MIQAELLSQEGTDTRKHCSVSELTARIRSNLEQSFPQVWVSGEVSNYRPAGSGHAYFTLKDSQSMLSAAIFGWGSRKKFELKDGLEVLCRGKVCVYPPRGTYQLVIDWIQPLGAGALQAAFEQLKAKLAALGLFEAARKKPLPRYPSRVVMITSPTGAAVQDMLNIFRRRAPHLELILIPAVVQGDEAPTQLIRALEIAEKHSLGDVIIIGRGGGSIEDLSCFNNEALAYAISQCTLPVVSAVGHEIDFTISDFVADLRAPTPSAAAEIVSHHWVETAQQVAQAHQRIQHSMVRSLAQKKMLLSHIQARVVSPRDRLREQAQRTDELAHRLFSLYRKKLDLQQSLLHRFSGKLDALSPLKVLERGYVLLQDSQESVIKSVTQVSSGQMLQVKFYDGTQTVQAL